MHLLMYYAYTQAAHVFGIYTRATSSLFMRVF